MRYLRAQFKNYIGFYNGMNLDVVDIDFTKCQHNIILIGGKNGSGKSTLLNHLNPFPDGSNAFIPERSAEKNLVLVSEGDTYEIHIVSPADLKGRKTTKAYIRKNGIELNENGNVSSYKDIIFSEFELDSNYISLSRLSSNDRGLGDKTPAERKKFVSNIIDNLEVYNTMYKTLNKKSLVFKSHINTLHTKIQNIGSKEALEQRLSSLQSKEAELNKIIIDTNNQIVAIQAKTSIDEDEAKEMQLLTDRLNSINDRLGLINIELDSLSHKTKISKQDIERKYEDNKNLKQNYESKIRELTSIWKDKSSRLSDISSNILSIQAELESANLESDIADRYTLSCNTLNEITSDLKQIGILVDSSKISLMESLIIFCDRFVESIDRFRDDLTPDLAIILCTKDIRVEIMNKQKEIENLNQRLINLTADIESARAVIKQLSILESRPNNCKIDSCPLIADAVKTQKKLSKDKIDPIEELDKLQQVSLKISNDISTIQSDIDLMNSLMPKKMILDTIRENFQNNMDNLSLFYPNIVKNFEAMLCNLNGFDELRDHKILTDGVNLLKMYDAESRSNSVMKVEYESFKEKVKLVNSSNAMLERLKKEQVELTESISSLRSDIDNYQSTLNNLNSNIDDQCRFSNLIKEYNSIQLDYNETKSKLDIFSKKSSKAIEALSSINTLRSTIDSKSIELEPIMKDISTLSGQLILLDSYYEEFAKYKQSYDMIETLKKYCSPTGGGIQTLFMQIYMSKTKESANQVLSMLFNGSYQLLDFVINDSEFRIPFIGEGLPVDDISSGSSSQIAMMSMIINLVLLNQGSTKFNIAQLDECDAGLDSYNRSQFVNVLFHSMNVLNIEQLFIISHSMEIDNTFADLIKLKGYDDYESSIQSGNVIFDYNEIINNSI